MAELETSTLGAQEGLSELRKRLEDPLPGATHCWGPFRSITVPVSVNPISRRRRTTLTTISGFYFCLNCSLIRNNDVTIRLRQNRIKADNLVTDSSTELTEKNFIFKIPRPPALPMGPLVDPQGLILPRKPFNPCLDSKDRQDLHRELLFNQRIGKNVLNQKSELQRALEKQRDLQTKRELENEKNQNKSLLERVIEERARRMENLEKKEEPTTRLPEFMQVHARLKSCSNRDGK